MKSSFILTLLLVSASCPNIPKPKPTPEPPPLAEQCKPDQNCGCYYVKSGEGWVKLPACADSIPVPIQCSIPDISVTLVSPRPPAEFTEKLNSALVLLTGCEPQSRCVVNQEMHSFLSSLISELGKQGICSGTQTGSDEVCIGDSAKCQGYHAYACSVDCNKGTVGWAPGSVRDTWINDPKPTPDSHPEPSCGEPPRPSCEQVINCPPSLDRINLAVRDQAAWIIDATPQTGNKDWCNSNGFPGRNFCPLGPEGSDSRPICEAKFSYTWTLNGSLCGSGSSVCFLNGDPLNPLQLRVPKPASGLVRVCANNQVCAEGSIQ